MNEAKKIDKPQGNGVLPCVRRCSFIVIIRVFDKYFETKVFAENVDEAESIIENTIVNNEYQIMNLCKTK